MNPRLIPLTLACLLVAAPATAQVNYAVSGSTAYVTSSPNASGAIVINSAYEGKTVTSIGDYAFSGCTNLTSVTIPNSVISIGQQAFGNCTALKSVTIPDSVTRIGTSLNSAGNAGAFVNCTSLTNVIIGNSVTNIGGAAFFGCTNLTRVTIPASVTSIYAQAFYGCSRMTNFTFPGNAPALVFDIEAGGAHFLGVGAGAKAYYYCGTTGWGTSYGGLPTVMLCPPQFAPGSAGVKPGGFGFTVTRLTNQTIVVEASTNLLNWQPIWTNTLPGTAINFDDPEWTNHSNRFYRARSD